MMKRLLLAIAAATVLASGCSASSPSPSSDALGLAGTQPENASSPAPGEPDLGADTNGALIEGDRKSGVTLRAIELCALLDARGDLTDSTPTPLWRSCSDLRGPMGMSIMRTHPCEALDVINYPWDNEIAEFCPWIDKSSGGRFTQRQ
jgi:hypothetical protein